VRDAVILDPLQMRLPRSRGCAAVARRFVEQELGEALSRAALDDARLVVSELVDNAYVHGRGEISLRLTSHAERVRVEVADEGRGAALKIRERGPEDLGGNGLRLVEAISTAWGAYEGTTHVWADLPVR
jgi:anti-sigma regulatory factor (Ser/Thr protein kinase)